MSQQTLPDTASPSPAEPAFESQSQRWVKYGANVLLSVVLVLVLAGMLTYFAQRNNWRKDFTSSGSHSLSEMSRKILGDLKQKIRIVGLYPSPESTKVFQENQDFYRPVADLLEDYKSNSKQIDIEMIDVLSDAGRAKEEALIQDVSQKYGTQVKAYQAVLADLPKTAEKINAFATDESKKQESLANVTLKDEEVQKLLFFATALAQQFPGKLDDARETLLHKNIPAELDTADKGKSDISAWLYGPNGKDKPQAKKGKNDIPDYKGAVDYVGQVFDELSQLAGAVIEGFRAHKDAKDEDAKVKEYMAAALPRFEEIKKFVDAEAAKIKALGELKLDELRRSVKTRSILVMGEKDMKVIPFEDAWKAPDPRVAAGTGVTPKRAFAGEQQISSAILTLNSAKKPKVAFVRWGGMPMTMSMQDEDSARLSGVADELHALNFDVLEKDLSGQFAMQAQQQGMPVMEPDDKELKDAIWVVLDFFPKFNQRTGPSQLGEKLKAHLDAGGSAMVLTFPGTDDLEEALKPIGIRMSTDAMIVHEVPPAAGAQPADPLKRAERIPFVFITKKYGNHPIATPIGARESMLAPLVPVSITPTGGYKATPLIPVPDVPKAFGSREDMQTVMRGGTPTFHPPKPAAEPGGRETGDMPPPLFAGAAVERNAGGRLIVLGSAQFIFNDLMNMIDRDFLMDHKQAVRRFPGNIALFDNCIWWLSKMDAMLSIGPASTEQAVISDMPDNVQTAWHWAIPIVPGVLVLLIGAVVYLIRRD